MIPRATEYAAEGHMQTVGL